ncbi:migration and invasion-inhibitory protein isoform X1 [Brachyistius frenatus]|uniref:migration and invasion-inhibitory protein isoform X1 n=1 Tax=Brachyistius frenatus TaxID=100188 RepID=UPI0037E80CDF
MSTDRLDVLRERNKHLLSQLRQQREMSRKREREDEEMVTLTDGDRGPARAALSKPSVRFADTREQPTAIQQIISIPSVTFKHSEGTAEHKTAPDLLKGSHGHPRADSRLRDAGLLDTRSCLVNHSKEQREVLSQVTFQTDESEDIAASDRHHLQPLLGYDWIAGVLDAEDSLIERSDEFFNELRVFRSLNKDECVHSAQAQFVEENHPIPPPLTHKKDPEANMDTHQCTFSYRINSRLFPVPLHSHESCPVCKQQKSSNPHTMSEPALIRVSIPRTTLLPPHKYKAHRRCSFDPSDSLGLPSHCLSGWSNTGQSTLPPPGSLDLRSSLNTKNSSLNKELEALSAPKVSSSHDQNLDVSRLARHSFQHFSPKRKLGSTYHPVC